MYNAFYPPKARSPITELNGSIEAGDTTITLLDASKLPDAPNKATLGGGEDSETILYDGKDGNNLTGVTRGFDPPGSQKAWATETKVARVLTAQDIDALQTAHADHLNDNIDPHEYEDASNHIDFTGVKYKIVIEDGMPYMEVTES